MRLLRRKRTSTNYTDEIGLRLAGEFDAMRWAEEFVKLVRKRPEIARDADTMATWFAAAIMSGYDRRTLELLPVVGMSATDLCEFAFEVGGAATAPLLVDHPDYVFPSERVSEAIVPVIRERGVDPDLVPGYGSRSAPAPTR